MLRQRTTYFSRAPLNYESLLRRRARFDKWTHQPSDAVADYIVASRQLQALNRANHRYPTKDCILGIRLQVSSSELESDLWSFLRGRWLQCVASDDIVRAYVLSAPNVDVSRAFELVQANFRHQVAQHTVDGPVHALLHVLLRRRDYHGCFKLMDSTVASLPARQAVQARYAGVAAATTGAALCMAIVGAQALPVWLAASYVGVGVAAAWGTLYGFAKLHLADMPRVSWRPHTGLWHRLLHQKELLLVNKIVTHFEEHSEVNVRNYHYSQVRSVAGLGTFDQNDYELQLPASAELASVPTARDAATETISRYVTSELHKRKMRWNVLKEEEAFLQFWVSHGENFEWVEPDQDPAEMAHMADPR